MNIIKKVYGNITKEELIKAYFEYEEFEKTGFLQDGVCRKYERIYRDITENNNPVVVLHNCQNLIKLMADEWIKNSRFEFIKNKIKEMEKKSENAISEALKIIISKVSEYVTINMLREYKNSSLKTSIISKWEDEIGDHLSNCIYKGLLLLTDNLAVPIKYIGDENMFEIVKIFNKELSLGFEDYSENFFAQNVLDYLIEKDLIIEI